MTTELATIAPTANLAALPEADLVVRINDGHRQCELNARSALQCASEIGALLIEAKRRCSHGTWASWLRENCSVSERMTQTYMTLARELPKLPEAKAQRVADLSIRRS